MLEPIGIGAGASLLRAGISVGETAWKVLRPKRRRLTPSDRLAARAKWRASFEEEIRKNHREGLSRDVIVRDVGRVDQYPDCKEGRGISPWFRCALVGTYHRGIYLALRAESVVFDHAHGGWRSVNWDGGERTEGTTLLIGSVPFEQIEHLDLNGDEYYSYPHIYCHFDIKRQPYELIAYYIERDHPVSGCPPYQIKVADVAEVQAVNKRAGVRDPWRR
jgi:hypothetical protein